MQVGARPVKVDPRSSYPLPIRPRLTQPSFSEHSGPPTLRPTSGLHIRRRDHVRNRWAALVLVAVLAFAGTAWAADGEMTWGVHVSLAPTWLDPAETPGLDRKSTRLNSSHLGISYAVFC